MSSDVESSLDSVLTQLGDFGKYQVIMFTLVCVAIALHSAVHVAFVFTAMDLEYRCQIPECEPTSKEFEPPWLEYAVPYKDGHLPKCTRYLHKNETIERENSNCSASDFEINTETCKKFVYKTEENSIVKAYDLQCDDNLWKLTMVGTVNNLGQFIGLFLYGLISDKYGRRVTLIMGLVLCGICGISRTFAPTYIWFLVLEFLDSAFASGTYACGFIIGVELVGPKKRVIVSIMVNCCYAVGEFFTAGTAWLLQDWRYLIYTVYSPPLLMLVYFWIIPESVRWNLSKGRFEDAKKTLLKAAKFNGTTISDGALEKLKLAQEERLNTSQEKHSVVEVLKSTTLVLRLLNCCFCWITCAFLFYGLTLNSVALAGNPYLDFILTAFVEIPATLVNAYMIDKLGRKWSLSSAFFLTGVSCFIFLFVPKEPHFASLIVYLLGKCGATAAFNSTYLITSELFPTPLRSSLVGLCSTVGRIGSMVSPQTPLLAQIWNPLPLVMFTTMSVAAGLLTLLLPETLNIKLPDSIEEAVSIGTKNNNTPVPTQKLK